MRATLLTAAPLLPLLLLAAVATATWIDDEAPRSVSNALMLKTPTNVGKARDGLAAVEKLLEFYSTYMEKVFDVVPGGQFISVFVKALSFVGALLGFFGNSESAELREMRRQFAAVHSRLDQIQLGLEDVKDLIQWESTRSQYARCEKGIQSASKYFYNYLKEENTQSRNYYRTQFLREYGEYHACANTIYIGITKNGATFDNLCFAAVRFTKNYKTKVTAFLMTLMKVMLEASEMDIAYTRINDGEFDAKKKQAEWENKLAEAAKKVEQTDKEILSAFGDQIKSDIPEQITRHHRQSNQNFPRPVYDFFSKKFYWRRWFVLNYRNVAGHEHHTYAICGGDAQLRTDGNRNVLIASADPKTSRFTKSRGDTVLRAVNIQVRRRYAEDYVKAINGIVGNYCADAAARIAVCWGCDVWGIHAGGRLSYLRANPPLDARNRPCNNCHMHTYIFG